MTTLHLKNIVKRYKSQTVLDDLSLDVANGERLVLFGPSGAGKTVLLRLVAGVIEPDEGRVLIGGEDMTDVDAEHRGVGMAFQNFALFPAHERLRQYRQPADGDAVVEGCDHRGRAKGRQAPEDRPCTEPSPEGAFQRPEAAHGTWPARWSARRRCFCSTTRCAMSTRNSASRCGWNCRACLAAEGATVVYVTQDYKEAMALGDRIAVMSQGRIRQIGTPQEIYNAPADIEIARLFGDPTINLLDVAPQKQR